MMDFQTLRQTLCFLQLVPLIQECFRMSIQVAHDMDCFFMFWVAFVQQMADFLCLVSRLTLSPSCYVLPSCNGSVNTKMLHVSFRMYSESVFYITDGIPAVGCTLCVGIGVAFVSDGSIESKYWKLLLCRRQKNWCSVSGAYVLECFHLTPKGAHTFG